MNHPLTSAASSIYDGFLSAVISWRVWLFRTWVARLPVGQLTVTFPSGRRETFNGARPGENAHLNIHDMRVVNRLISAGDLGLAESFMAGEWSTPDLSAIMRFGLVNEQALGTTLQKTTLHRLFDRLHHARHTNTRRGSRRNIAAHYDLGNVFYGHWLDPSMTYSSALFETLDEPLAPAQRRKYLRLAAQLDLQPGDQLLEIGCGWGGFACYLARQYGVRVTGITISREQFDFACQRVIDEGLADRVDIQFSDFRDLKGEFDKIASIEMVEALGDAQVDVFFARCRELLKRDGVLAIQMIMSPDSRYEELKGGVDFIQKHIFPGSLLLSMERVVKATSSTSNLHLIGMKEFPESYAKTLSQWSSNFQDNLDKVRELGFSEQFIRKWLYYFAYCEAAFDMRQISVVQFAMTGPNNLKLREKRSL